MRGCLLRTLALGAVGLVAMPASAQRPASDEIPRTPVQDETWPPGYDRTRTPGQPMPRESRTANGTPRVTLLSSGRPVVLLSGGASDARRDARLAPDAARVVSQATIEDGPDGAPVVVYSASPALPPDIGREMGCGPAAGLSLGRLRSLAEAPLALGDEGAMVGAAQQLLCVIGYAVPQDGMFSEDMQTAVLVFQTDVNLGEANRLGADEAPDPETLLGLTGMLDPRTRRVLEARASDMLGE